MGELDSRKGVGQGIACMDIQSLSPYCVQGP